MVIQIFITLNFDLLENKAVFLNCVCLVPRRKGFLKFVVIK
jgi:hypothetical protein